MGRNLCLFTCQQAITIIVQEMLWLRFDQAHPLQLNLPSSPYQDLANMWPQYMQYATICNILQYLQYATICNILQYAICYNMQYTTRCNMLQYAICYNMQYATISNILQYAIYCNMQVRRHLQVPAPGLTCAQLRLDACLKLILRAVEPINLLPYLAPPPSVAPSPPASSPPACCILVSQILQLTGQS